MGVAAGFGGVIFLAHS